MGRVEGKVAFVTGAARGQGREHALRLAAEGASIIAVDIDHDIETSYCATARAEDLDETVAQVEGIGGRILARIADVRDLAALQDVVAEGVETFGNVDIVIANAGIISVEGMTWEIDERHWQELIDINLTGAWKTVRAAVPTMIEQGSGGSIILTSSVAGVSAFVGIGHYVAAKHGVTGLMRALAVELAPHGIRANSIHPTTVRTPMLDNPAGYRLFGGGRPGATIDDVARGGIHLHALATPWVEESDVANLALFLASDESRFITGTTQLVDAGATLPFKIPQRA